MPMPHLKRREVVDALVVGDGADDDDDLLVVAGLLRVAHEARDGERRAMATGHEQTAHHDLVELASGAAGQVAVELNRKV